MANSVDSAWIKDGSLMEGWTVSESVISKEELGQSGAPERARGLRG